MSKEDPISALDEGDEIKAVSGYIGFVFDDYFLAMPKGYVPLGKVFFECLVAEDLKSRRYPAHEEWRALVAFQRRLCDGELTVWLLTDAAEQPIKVPRIRWGDNRLISQALRSGWQDIGEGKRGVYVVQEGDLQAWRRLPAIQAELDNVRLPLSPFMVTMQLVTGQLGISVTNHGHKKNEVVPAIQALWKELYVPPYDPLTDNQADWMASFVRWPEAMKGLGNDDNVARKKKTTSKRHGKNLAQPSVTEKKLRDDLQGS